MLLTLIINVLKPDDIWNSRFCLLAFNTFVSVNIPKKAHIPPTGNSFYSYDVIFPPFRIYVQPLVGHNVFPAVLFYSCITQTAQAQEENIKPE
jgi:hypothetical protein